MRTTRLVSSRTAMIVCVVLLQAACRSNQQPPAPLSDASPVALAEASTPRAIPDAPSDDASRATPACPTLDRHLALPDRVQRRMRKVMAAARREGPRSLAGPALVAASRRCADRLHESVRQLSGSQPSPQEQRLVPAMLTWFGQAEAACRKTGDDASNALASRSDQDWADVLEGLKSELDGLADSWRAAGEQSRQVCGEHAGAAALPAVQEAPIEIRSRVRSSDGAMVVLVPAGEFVSGADDDDAELDEGPVRWGETTSFWIDRTEVTVDRYRACMKAGPCTPPGTGPSCNRAGGAQGEHPANCIRWDQAVSYCHWAGARLPTEAEWEKAARGPSGRKYPWGQQDPSCDRTVFFDPIRGHGCGTHATFPVGSKPSGASPYGALDMAGSVWEWVADPYSADPAVPAVPQGTAPMRLLRGGGWGKDGHGSLRSTMRLRFAPSNATPGTGFRCAMDDDEVTDSSAPIREGGS